jgi:hypothetical protein
MNMMILILPQLIIQWNSAFLQKGSEQDAWSILQEK